MNILKSFMVSVFLLALASCAPSPTLEGTVISTKVVGGGITEHLIETNNFHTPYYILRVNNNNLHQGSKVILELSADSMAHRSN